MDVPPACRLGERSSAIVRLAAAGLLTCAVGCGSDLGATVSGKVTIDGEPVTPGLVTFAPVDGAHEPSTGTLGSGGEYRLSTKQQFGVAPGTYAVAVQAFEPPDVPAGQRSFTPSKPLVPEKYLQTTTSGLQYRVASGSNTINIELTGGK